MLDPVKVKIGMNIIYLEKKTRRTKGKLNLQSRNIPPVMAFVSIGDKLSISLSQIWGGGKVDTLKKKKRYLQTNTQSLIDMFQQSQMSVIWHLVCSHTFTLF